LKSATAGSKVDEFVDGGNSTRANTIRQRIFKYIENRLNKDEEMKGKKVNAAKILGNAPTKDRFTRWVKDVLLSAKVLLIDFLLCKTFQFI